MFSIQNNDKYEEIIKYSKFIALLFKVQNEKEAAYYLADTKEKYHDATHYCYGYKIDNISHFSDDREPSKTAGLPILNQINAHNLNYVLIIVVRYFGGIKLGTGLLTRTYSSVARKVLRKENIIKLLPGFDITITFDYQELKKIDYLLKDEKIITKEFADKVIYNAHISKDTLTKLSKYDLQINKQIYIEAQKN